MSERIKMKVTMDVTVPQAIALRAMFKYWNELSAMGSSRRVSFMVDGDGNFHPNCMVASSMPEITEEITELAVVEDDNGHRVYDFDAIAWHVNHQDA